MAVHLQASLRGFIISFEEATSHWWFQVPQLPSALSLPPPPNTHRKISTKALPKPNPHRLLHQSQAVETAEGGNTLHVLVPKFKCVITRSGNVVSIFSIFRNGCLRRATPSTYVSLPGEDAYPRTVVCIVLSHCRWTETRGRRRYHYIKTRQQISFPTGPPKLYAARDFSFQLYASSLAFCIIIQSIGCAAQLWNTMHQKCHTSEIPQHGYIGLCHLCCTLLLPLSAWAEDCTSWKREAMG